MADAGPDHDRRLGRLGFRGLLPDERLDASSAVDDPGSQPDVVSAGGTTLPSASASSQSVWNDCQDSVRALLGRHQPRQPAAAGSPSSGPANPGQPVRQLPTPRPVGSATCRAVPDIVLSGRPLGRRRRGLLRRPLDRASAAPASPRPPTPGSSPTPTRAATARSGRVGPALYAAQQAAATASPTSLGQQRLHRHQPRGLRRHHRLRRGQRPRHARRPEPGHRAAGRGRVPVGGGREPRTRDRSAGAAPSRSTGAASPTPPRSPSARSGGGRIVAQTRDLHHRRPAQRRRPPSASTSRSGTRRASRRSPPPTSTASAATSTAARATASSPPTGASSTSGTPASGAAPAACR